MWWVLPFNYEPEETLSTLSCHFLQYFIIEMRKVAKSCSKVWIPSLKADIFFCHCGFEFPTYSNNNI